MSETEPASRQGGWLFFMRDGFAVALSFWVGECTLTDIDTVELYVLVHSKETVQ